MQPLRPDQTTIAAKTLTEAFCNDPLLENVSAPDEKERAAAGQWFFETSIKAGWSGMSRFNAAMVVSEKLHKSCGIFSYS